MDSKYTDYLDTTIKDDLKPVTYKSLARAFKIHANTAKQILYEYSKDKHDVFVMYCITGTTTIANQFNIKLTKATHLEATKSAFKNISGIHVYSLSRHELNDFGQLTTVCKAQLSLDERLQCGITKKENIRVRSVKEAAHEGKKAEKKVEKSFSKPEQPKTTTKPEQPKASTKPEQPKSMFLGKRKPEEVDESEQPNKKANVGPQKTNPFSAENKKEPVKKENTAAKSKAKKGKQEQKSITSFFKK